jgi:hypothetical protein
MSTATTRITSRDGRIVARDVFMHARHQSANIVQVCSENGWHIAGRPRIPLLQAQHDRALGSTQTQAVLSTTTAGALPSPLFKLLSRR